MKKLFLGRDDELTQVTEELSRDDRFEDPARILYLRGDDGIGKTTFFNHLYKRFQKSPLNIIWIRPQSWTYNGYDEHWPTLFTRTIETNQDTLRQKVKSFQEAALKVPAGAPDTHVTGAPSPDMDHWLTSFSQEIFGASSLDKCQSGKDMRILFVLDHYDRMTSEKKQWFAKNIFEPLSITIPDLDVRFLLSGEQSFYQTVDLESYWVPFQTDVKEIELQPLSKQDTLEFVDRQGIRLPKDYDIYEVTGGIPAKIETVLANHQQQQSYQLQQFTEVDSLFSSIYEEDKNWILGAAHLGTFTEESLRIFGTHEGAYKAYKWLRNQDMIHVAKTAEGYQLDEKWRELLLRWQEQHRPEQYRKLAARVETFSEVCQFIPEREHRENLALLSLFNYFNPGVLEKVYPKQAEQLSSFVYAYIHYFIKTNSNFKISMQYQSYVQNYVRLIPFEDREALKQKVAYQWEQAREKYIKEQKSFQKEYEENAGRLRAMQEKLKPTTEQIKKREKSLGKQKRKIDTKKNRAVAPPPGEPASKLLTGSICSLGIVLLYGGLLFSQGIQWYYTLIGAALVIAGMFWPSHPPPEGNKPTPARDTTAERAEEEEEEDSLIRMLNLKKVGLENQISQEAIKVSRIKRRLEALRALLNEPYVYL